MRDFLWTLKWDGTPRLQLWLVEYLGATGPVGDPDLACDELQLAIDRAEQQRQNLLDAQPAAKQSVKVLSMLPRAAEAYRRQFAEDLSGNPREALKARAILRAMLGEIRLVPSEDGALWPQYEMHPAALLRQDAGTCGSGGTLRQFPAQLETDP